MLQEAEILRNNVAGKELETALSGLNKVYTEHYHAAEKQLARQVAREIEHWEEIYEVKDLLPYLTFHAIIDERTRDSHAALDGFTFRVDDPNRKKYTPPLDYNCRCFLTQEFEPPEGSTVVAPKDFKPKPTFERDYRKNKRIFTDKMPFMNQARSEELGLTPVKFSNADLFKPMNKAMCEMLPKLQHGWEKHTTKEGGVIMRHVFSNEKTFTRELEQLSGIVRKGETAWMNPELKMEISSVFKNFNNPDAFIGGRFFELKKQDGGNVKLFFKNHFTDAVEKQMASVVVMEVRELDWEAIEKQLLLRWKGEQPTQVIIQKEGSKYVLEKDKWIKQIEPLKPKKAFK